MSPWHDYERRRGLLTRAWPGWLEEHGPFDVEPPLSPAMQAFLARHRLERPAA